MSRQKDDASTCMLHPILPGCIMGVALVQTRASQTPALKGSVMAAMLGLARKYASSRLPQTEASPGALDESLERLASARRAGDPIALRQCESIVVERFRPLADRIARRYRGRGVEDDDLVQLARLGLCKAVRRWSRN